MTTNANYIMTIGGSQVNVIQGSLDVVNQIGQRSTGTVQVWSALGTTWQYGTRVQVFDLNNTLVYSGYTSKDEVTKSSRQGHGYLEHTITLMDNCYRADKRYIWFSTLNMPAGNIVKYLANAVLAGEGVTYTSKSIAAGQTVTQVIWNGKQISAALDWLAKVSGYWWNIDTNGVLWFQPYTGLPAPFVLDGTQVAVDSTLKVTFGNDMYVNRQYVKGGYQETGTRTESQHGDGLKTSFALSYDLASTAAADLSITVNGVAQTIGTKGDTGDQFYAAVGDCVVAQDAGQPVLSSSDTIAVTYKGRYPIVALAWNPTLVAAQKAREGGGTGFVESLFTNAKIYAQGAAYQQAGALLSYYGKDMTQVEFNMLASAGAGLLEGQMLTVNLTDFGLNNAQMLVSEVEITDSVDESFNVYYHVIAIGSPYAAAQWQTYWQNLQNQSSDPNDFTNVDTGASVVALLQSSFITLSPTVVVHPTHTTCLICNTSTLCGTGQIVC